MGLAVDTIFNVNGSTYQIIVIDQLFLFDFHYLKPSILSLIPTRILVEIFFFQLKLQYFETQHYYAALMFDHFLKFQNFCYAYTNNNLLSSSLFLLS